MRNNRSAVDAQEKGNSQSIVLIAKVTEKSIAPLVEAMGIVIVGIAVEVVH